MKPSTLRSLWNCSALSWPCTRSSHPSQFVNQKGGRECPEATKDGKRTHSQVSLTATDISFGVVDVAAAGDDDDDNKPKWWQSMTSLPLPVRFDFLLSALDKVTKFEFTAKVVRSRRTDEHDQNAKRQKRGHTHARTHKQRRIWRACSRQRCFGAMRTALRSCAHTVHKARGTRNFGSNLRSRRSRGSIPDNSPQ